MSSNDGISSDIPSTENDSSLPTSLLSSPIRSTTQTITPSSHSRFLNHHQTVAHNMDRDRSNSFSSPAPSSSSMNFPLSTSPVMPFLPNLTFSSNNSMTMSPPLNNHNITNMSRQHQQQQGRRWSMSSDEFTPSSQRDQKAIDSAVSSERSRIKEMEKKENEADLSVDDVKLILKRERSRMTKLVGELAALKSMSVASQAEAEVCEEGRINGLMRRMDCLQKEKGRIIVELEREEEMLTNTLQKKLNEVRREKAELEKQIEKEHSYNLELKAKLDKMESLRPHTAISVDSTSSLNSENHMNVE